MKQNLLKNDFNGDSPTVLFMSSSLLDDRKLLYTDCLDVLSESNNVKVWATSARTPEFKKLWENVSAQVEEFPEVLPFRAFPFNYLRRLNEFAWDYKLRPPSRISFAKHVRNKRQKAHVQALKIPARMVAALGAAGKFENWLDRLLPKYNRSAEAFRRLQTSRPAVLITTGPNRFEGPAIIGVAKNLGIPTLALIHSWDNLSTKNRMVFKYDGYLVWSEQMKKELHHFYPESRQRPVYIVGAAQFDVFFQERFFQTREEFCRSQGLNPEKPFIVYALGSPNLIREHHGAFKMAKRCAAGELGDVQLLIRPHPQFDDGREADILKNFPANVVVQKTGNAGRKLTDRFQDENQIREWVNTFRHADVVVNLSSTVTIDAAICDRPIVNLDFDPEPGKPNQRLVKDINHLWTHFKPIAESGGIWLVNDYNEMVHAVKTYLKNPALHKAQRRWIAEYVCGFLDGKSGARTAEAVGDFVKNLRGSRFLESAPAPQPTLPRLETN
jgi:glycosyltransferase involved in cell wall biosynthesis